MAPPQHGKSELASVRLPAYWLGHRPNDPIILTSYAASLAYDKSRQARDLVESLEYQRLFPGTKTRRDKRAVADWGLRDARGGVVAAGVGGPITGHGALLGIIDDPIEHWEQAQSVTLREKVWEWWQRTFRTRIWEHGAIVLIMTRWHEDDLGGRLLERDRGEWRVLRLPAVAETQEVRDDNAKRLNQPVGRPDPLGREPDEPLCPKRFSEQELKAVRGDVGELGWHASYQGAPRAPEGTWIKRSWFEVVDGLPDGIESSVRYWDKAATPGGGAYTCGVLMHRANGTYYIGNVRRGQWATGERERIIRETAEADAVLEWPDDGNGYHIVDPGPEIWMEQEPGSSGKDSVIASIRNLRGFRVHADRVTGSKLVRLQPFITQAEVGNVKLVRGLWNEAWLNELTAVPNSRYMDQVDGTSGAFNRVTRSRPKARSRQG